jgi:hypothetical protein
MMSFLISVIGGSYADVLDPRVQWVRLNQRDGRALIDVLVKPTERQALIDALTSAGLDPVVVGGWHPNGRRLRGVPINRAEFIRVGPEVPLPTQEGGGQGQGGGPPPGKGRPTDFVQTHSWMGWAEQTDEEGDADPVPVPPVRGARQDPRVPGP